jgi:X-Pro dipeptidyl-peptidase
MVSLPWEESRQMRPTDNIITRGRADLQNHRSMTQSEPLVPGKFYEMTFELEPDDQIIPAGKQIGLMIFSSDKEFTLHPDPGTELTIDLDGTEVTIPIVGGNIK